MLLSNQVGKWCKDDSRSNVDREGEIFITKHPNWSGQKNDDTFSGGEHHMKHGIAKIAQFAIIVGLTLGIMMGMAGPPIAAYQGESALAWKAADGIIIDGSLEEWNRTSPISLKLEQQVFRDANQWFGETDLSADVYVMWDLDNLYLAAEVKDDTPFMYREGFPADLADSLVFYIGLDSASDSERTSYAPTDFRVLLILDDYLFNTAIDRSMVSDTRGFESIGEYGDEQALSGYEAVIEPVDRESYIFEAKIPWSNFSNDHIPVFEPADGLTVGFSVELNDLDFPCPGVATPGICWTGSGECIDNPSQWGELMFKDGGQ